MNANERRWHPGDVVRYEGVAFGDVFVRVPVRVICDEPGLVTLWMAPGSSLLTRVLADGHPVPRVMSADEYARLDTRLEARSYAHGILAAIPTDRSYAIQLSWEDPGWRFRGWYVNVQTPLERTPHGFRARDLYLDVVVDPDRAWRLKDEDELAEAVSKGRLTQSEADGILDEADRLIPDIEARRFPFDDTYIDFRPDPSWTVPSIGTYA